MNKIIFESQVSQKSQNTGELVMKGLAKRRAAERRFRIYGLAGIILGLLFLFILFTDIAIKGYSAFIQTKIELEINVDPIMMGGSNLTQDELIKADYGGLIKKALRKTFPNVKSRREKKELYRLISSGANFELRDLILQNPSLIGMVVKVWLPANDDIDMLIKGKIDISGQQGNARISKRQIAWVNQMQSQEQIKTQFNSNFFTAGDSREPELAGIRGALMGSIFTLIGTFFLAFPVGVATAIYLEEFAPINKWTDLIEVNINNLAAVPSIVFGLLGLAMFINFFGLPRSTPIVGSLVLALMTLPTIIIAGRSVLKSVPPSIREAALGMGASQLQTVFHHVLPLAMPGMMTGAIIGMARALGETAPLLMIGMVAFIVDIPSSFTQPATVLPVQIYLWADSPERAFVEKTSAAIMVLLLFLIAMNGLAVYLRKHYERRW